MRSTWPMALDFKNKAEQNKLESEGKYTEARQALEQQFREATAEKDKRIAELEARVRELESRLITEGWHLSALACLLGIPPLVAYWWRMRPSADDSTD